MNHINPPLVVSGLFATLGLSRGLYSLLLPFDMAAVFGVPFSSPASSPPPADAKQPKESNMPLGKLFMAAYTAQNQSKQHTIAFARAKGARDLSTSLAYCGRIWLVNWKGVGALL